MTQMSPRRLVALGVAALFIATGCGLKGEAVDSLKSSGTVGGSGAAAGAGGVGGTSGTGAAGGTGTGPGGSISGGSSGGTAAGGSGTSAGGSGNSGGSGGAAARKCGVPSGGSTTGVSASTISLGVHAPLTGTGLPLPNESFDEGSKKYWEPKYGHLVCGRKISIDFQDDEYNPETANAKCRAMARRDFIVLGGAGTDQIQACATNSEIRGTGAPYLSAGVTTNGLTGLKNYFALSLSYEQQGTLVVRNALTNGIGRPAPARGGQKKQWAIVTAKGKNFDDATAGIHKALAAQGISYQDFRIDQNGDYQAAAAQQGTQLAQYRYKTIFVVTAPGYFVAMAGGYYRANTGTVANWVGPGVTFTVVTVATTICPGTLNAIHGHAWFLAPFPGLDRASAEFKRVYGSEYDDVHWALWGISESIYRLLLNASSNLTRENFIKTTEQSQIPSGSYPPLDFKNRGHFGGTGAWVQRINCQKAQPNQDRNGTWDTIGSSYLKI